MLFSVFFAIFGRFSVAPSPPKNFSADALDTGRKYIVHYFYDCYIFMHVVPAILIKSIRLFSRIRSSMTLAC